MSSPSSLAVLIWAVFISCPYRTVSLAHLRPPRPAFLPYGKLSVILRLNFVDNLPYGKLSLYCSSSGPLVYRTVRMQIGQAGLTEPCLKEGELGLCQPSRRIRTRFDQRNSQIRNRQLKLGARELSASLDRESSLSVWHQR